MWGKLYTAARYSFKTTECVPESEEQRGWYTGCSGETGKAHFTRASLHQATRRSSDGGYFFFMRGHGHVRDPLWVLDYGVSWASLHLNVGPVYASNTHVAHNAHFKQHAEYVR